MAKYRLTKAQLAERDTLVETLRKDGDILSAAITALNEAMLPHCVALEEALEIYNEHLEAARVFVSGITETAQGEFDEMSERWQESDKGAVAKAWIDAWNDTSLDDVMVEIPEQLDPFDASEHAVPLEDLPEAATDE